MFYIMKKNYILTSFSILLAYTALFLVSCNEEQEWTEIYEFAYKMGADDVSVGAEILFTDLSLGVKSREWYFQDATPATSVKAEQKIIFNSRGVKKCSLTVVYTDGKIESEEFEVDVKQILSGKINVEKMTPMECLYLNEENIFEIADFAGAPTSVEWTFEGGTPATSTELSPRVTWTRGDTYTVTLSMTRTDDGATFSDSRDYIVGPYPMLKTLPDEQYDAYGFEFATTGAWILWGSTDHASTNCSVVDGGADGSAKCMQISFDGLTGGLQLFCRDSWVSNAHLEKSKDYQLSFWAKAEKSDPTAVVRINNVRIINFLAGWLYNPMLDVVASAGWDKYWSNIEFEEQSEVPVVEPVSGKWTLNETWTKYSLDFRVPDGYMYDNTLNTYPFFIVPSANMKNLYIDEIQINLIEK